MASERILRRKISDLWPPVLAGIVALAAAIVWRTIAGTRIFAEVALDATVDVLPGKDFSTLLGSFGPYGKALFFVSVLVGQLLVFLFVWVLARRSSLALSQPSRAGLAGLAAAVIFLAGTVIFTATTNASLGRETGSLSYLIATFGFCGVFALVAHLQTLEVGAGAEANQSRRRLLTQVPGLVLGGLALLVLGRTLRQAASSGAQVSRPGQPTPEVTTNDDFYKVSKNLFDPDVNGGDWLLTVRGLVDSELELRYEDILAMPWQEQYTTMQCISNRVGGDLMSNALWRGVPLRAVLEAAGVQPEAKYLLMRCADEYTETLPLDFITGDQIMLAYQMNGVPLPSDHGFPLRLLAPGKYGMKHTKWIVGMILIQEEQFGFWQRQGWSQEARMNTSVRIDVPADSAKISGGSLVVQGVAFAGDRGISKVEVSSDNGATWKAAELKSPLSPYTWVLWQYEWRDTAKDGLGEKVLVARAWDGNGELQRDDRTDPYPDGAAIFHRLYVTVVEEA